MSSVFERLIGRTSGPGGPSRGFAVDDWFSFGGNKFPLGISTSMPGAKEVEIVDNFAGLVRGVHDEHGVVGAAVFARALLLSYWVPQWRNRATKELFGTTELARIERPSDDESLSDLLRLAETHVSYGGGAFFYRHPDRGIRALRPDLVDVVLGSTLEPDHPQLQSDAVVAGYLYHEGGRGSTTGKVTVLAPARGGDGVAQWKPEPDPLSPWRGRSWVTSIVRELQVDAQALLHMGQFFEGGATPNVVYSMKDTMKPAQLKEMIELFDEKYAGASKGWKSMFIGGGADVSVVGAVPEDLALRDVRGGAEEKVSMRSRIPAVVLGIREGMQGSALNSGNYGQTRRLLADGFVTPTYRSLSATLERLVAVPTSRRSGNTATDSELWFDSSENLFLQEDQKDAADILQMKAAAARQLVDGGFGPDSVVEALTTNDLGKLTHSGNLSVQLQPPGADRSRAVDVPLGRVADLVAAGWLYCDDDDDLEVA